MPKNNTVKKKAVKVAKAAPNVSTVTTTAGTITMTGVSDVDGKTFVLTPVVGSPGEFTWHLNETSSTCVAANFC